MNRLDVRPRTGPAAPQVRWAWWRSRHHRARLHDRPLLTPSSAGRLRLPGIGVETVLVEAPDPYRRPTALVLVPETGHASVTLDVRPPTRDIPLWIEDLGAWAALLATDRRPAGCAVVLQRPDEPDRGRVRLQVTWRVTEPPGGGDQAGMAVDVLARVPRLVQSLYHGSVGTATPMDAAGLAAVVRGGYRPDTDGPAPAGRPLWDDAGPTDPVERWQTFRHGGTASRTWSLRRVLPSVVLSTIAPSLAAVPPDVARTRVTLLHRAGTDAGTDAGPPRLSLLITLTAPAEGEAAGAGDAADGGRGDGLTRGAQTLLDRLPASLRPWLRPCYGLQAAAFAAGLPTGTLLGPHTAVPGPLPGS
jgi:hypothetical protein